MLRIFEYATTFALVSATRDRGKYIAFTTTPISLIIFDLDNFKHINDERGHAEGDRVLVIFTLLIGQCTRRMDRFFRYGGEEFVLLLPGVGVTELFVIAEKLRLKISSELRSAGDVITVSLGAAPMG